MDGTDSKLPPPLTQEVKTSYKSGVVIDGSAWVAFQEFTLTEFLNPESIHAKGQSNFPFKTIPFLDLYFYPHFTLTPAETKSSRNHHTASLTHGQITQTCIGHTPFSHPLMLIH